MFNIGKCKLFVWLKLGSQKDNSSEFFKDIEERSIFFNVYFSPFFFAKKKKTPHSLELVVPFSAHYVAKIQRTTTNNYKLQLQYKQGFSLWSLITASKVWPAYMAKCWDFYGFKVLLPLDFHLNLSLIPASFSFLDLYFFYPSF